MAAHRFMASNTRGNPADGDAELIVLGFELEAAWRRELELEEVYSDGEAIEEAGAKPIVERIAELTPTTFERLIVQAKAAAWCAAGDLTCDHEMSEAV
jgi:hypothetical protein